MGLATDITVYLSRRGEALKVNELTFTIRASDSSWHPGLPGRPMFPIGGLHAEVFEHRHLKRFRGGLVFEAHRLVYHSTLGLRVGLGLTMVAVLSTARRVRLHEVALVQGYLAYKKPPRPRTLQ